MSNPIKKPAISLSVNSRLKPLQSTHVQNVFGNEDSDEEKPQTSAEKFHSKYGNLKARDERAVKKVLEENPDIYDYDAAYGSIQEKRSRIEQEEETKKLDRTAKYTDKFMQAKKKRDLEKLLRDERKQEKEREAEGDEFKGKDVFITSAYREQLEETVKFRKELEESDRIDDLTGVRGQKMWRENFGKKLLDDRLKGRYGIDDEEETEQKPVLDVKQIKLEEGSDAVVSHRNRHDSDDEEPRHHRRSDDRRRNRDDRHSRSDRRRSRSRDRHSDDRRRSRHSKRGDRRHRSRSKDRHSRKNEEDRRRSSKDKSSSSKASFREAEKMEFIKRMKAIRQILKQRNTKKDIENARQRYLQRRRDGLIVPPV